MWISCVEYLVWSEMATKYNLVTGWLVVGLAGFGTPLWGCPKPRVTVRLNAISEFCIPFRPTTNRAECWRSLIYDAVNREASMKYLAVIFSGMIFHKKKRNGKNKDPKCGRWFQLFFCRELLWLTSDIDYSIGRNKCCTSCDKFHLLNYKWLIFYLHI